MLLGRPLSVSDTCFPWILCWRCDACERLTYWSVGTVEKTQHQQNEPPSLVHLECQRRVLRSCRLDITKDVVVVWLTKNLSSMVHDPLQIESNYKDGPEDNVKPNAIISKVFSSSQHRVHALFLRSSSSGLVWGRPRRVGFRKNSLDGKNISNSHQRVRAYSGRYSSPLLTNRWSEQYSGRYFSLPLTNPLSKQYSGRYLSQSVGYIRTLGLCEAVRGRSPLPFTWFQLWFRL